MKYPIDSEEREVARILRDQTDRIDKLEEERHTEAVPNPLRAVYDESETDDETGLTEKEAGSMNWGDPWGVSEWRI